MASIVVSYAITDAPVARSIIERIRSAGHTITVDQTFLSPNDSVSGTLRKHLRDADLVVLLVSSASARSRWATEEIAETLALEDDHGMARLMPCSLEVCDLPDELTRPEIRQRIDLDFSVDFDKAMALLLERIASTAAARSSSSFARRASTTANV